MSYYGTQEQTLDDYGDDYDFDYWNDDYLDYGDSELYGPDDYPEVDVGENIDPTDWDFEYHPDEVELNEAPEITSNPFSRNDSRSGYSPSSGGTFKPSNKPSAPPRPRSNPQGNLQPTARPRSTNTQYMNIGGARYPATYDRLGNPVYRTADRGQRINVQRATPVYNGAAPNAATLAGVATQNVPLILAGAFVLVLLVISK